VPLQPDPPRPRLQDPAGNRLHLRRRLALIDLPALLPQPEPLPQPKQRPTQHGQLLAAQPRRPPQPRRWRQPRPPAAWRRPDPALPPPARERHRLGQRRRHRRSAAKDPHRLELPRQRRRRRNLRCRRPAPQPRRTRRPLAHLPLPAWQRPARRHPGPLRPPPQLHLQRPEPPDRSHHPRCREDHLHLRRRPPRQRHLSRQPQPPLPLHQHHRRRPRRTRPAQRPHRRKRHSLRHLDLRPQRTRREQRTRRWRRPPHLRLSERRHRQDDRQHRHQPPGGRHPVPVRENLLGASRVSTISQPLVPGFTRRFTYDPSNGNLLSQTDFNGHLTLYTYDSRHLETQRIEAAGTPDARTTRTEWHPAWRLPLRIAEPLKRTTFTYDPAGNLLTRSEQATPDVNGSQGFAAPLVGSPRTWTWTYHSVGQVLTADGPRTDVADLTTYTYYDAADPDPGKRGQLASVTNALGQRSDLTAYDLNGRPLTLIDPNGLVTTFTYDARGRLTSQTVGDEHTAYTYDPAGQLTRLTPPDGSFLAYTYDPAHRLTQITDALGNTLTYTLDAAGNRVKEEWRDPAHVLSQTRQRVHDALSRLTRELGALDQLQADYAYDPQGNLTTLTTPHGAGTRSSTQAFDALNRLIRVTDPSGGLTQYAYDGQHRLSRVTDPRNLATRYTVDGLGNATGLDSPDSGVSSRTFDAAGNELTHTDAQGQTTFRQYDALNRLTHIEQRDAADTLLTAIDRQYDPHGRLTQETRQIAGVPFTTHYRYTHGRLTGLTTPGGQQIDYSLNPQGQISEVRLTTSGQVKTLASAITYHPSGALQQLTNGSGQRLTWGQDADGRPASYILANETWQIAYDSASRLASQSKLSDPTQTASYGYDPLDRLTQAVLPSVTHGYGYDATGNRLSQTSGAATRRYTLSPTSNRLSAIAGSQAKAYTTDANGSLAADGAGQTFTYDARGRLTGVTVAGVATTYRLDPLGQRIRKTGSDDTLYHYDQAGRLISETAPDGSPRKDYVWLGDQPLAILQ